MISRCSNPHDAPFCALRRRFPLGWRLCLNLLGTLGAKAKVFLLVQNDSPARESDFRGLHSCHSVASSARQSRNCPKG